MSTYCIPDIIFIHLKALVFNLKIANVLYVSWEMKERQKNVALIN